MSITFSEQQVRKKAILELERYLSLEKQIKRIKKDQERESERLTSINNQRRQKQIDLETLCQKGLELEQRIKQLEGELSLLEGAGVASRVELLEEKTLELMEQLEEVEEEKCECLEFLRGSLKALTEIQTEVDQENQKREQQIEQLHLEQQELTELSHPSVAAVFSELKKRDSPELHRIRDDSCSRCRQALGLTTIAEVERDYVLKRCPQCKTLLLPSF